MEKKWLVIILVSVSWILGCRQRSSLSEPTSDGNLKSSPAHGQPGDHIRSGFYERARSAFAKVDDLNLTMEEARALFEELLTLANDVENAALVNHTMSFTSEQKRRFFRVRDALGWANVAIGNNNLDVAIAYLAGAAGELVEVLKKPEPSDGPPGGDIPEDPKIRSGFYDRARSAFAKVEDLNLTMAEARALFEELLTLANDVENAALVNHTMSFTSEQKRRFFQVRDSLGWANVAIGNNNLDAAIGHLEGAAGELVEVLKKPEPSDGPPGGDIPEDPKIRSGFYDRARSASAKVEDLNLTMAEARALFEELLTLANDVENAALVNHTMRFTSEQRQRFFRVRDALGSANVAIGNNNLDVAIAYLAGASGELVEILKTE